MKAAEAVATGAERLPTRRGLPDPRREAHWLLATAWGVDEVWLRIHDDKELPADVEERYTEWIERRAHGVPAHHLTGRCTFWGLELEVSPAVLVPRPETELLVQAVLELVLPTVARVLDVGTGSACIPIALASERASWSMTAVDRSAAALAVAARNADRVGADIALIQGSLANAVTGPFDLVTANLPYVPTGSLNTLHREVLHDPVLALDGGVDGLDLIRELLADLPRVLAPGGLCVLEIGEGQADRVAEIGERSDMEAKGTIRDLGGIERVVILSRRS